MTVNKGEVPVNPNGSNEPVAGWTQAHVMDALEKVFYQMGWNSGTQKNGVPIAALFPGYNTSSSNDFNSCIRNDTDAPSHPDGNGVWGRCGGAALTNSQQRKRYFYITNAGTQSYEIAEEIEPINNQFVSNNVITVNYMGDNLTTGTKLTYNGQGTAVLSQLSSGNVYYMRRVSDNQISLHDTASNAQDASGTAGIQSVTASYNTDPLRFRTDAQTNPAITMYVGDDAYFYTHATTDGGDFRVCDFTAGASYSSDRHYHDSTNNTDVSHDVTGTGAWLDPYYWDTRNFYQTENEVFDPTQLTDVGYQGVYAYGYANSANASMKGTITLNPAFNNNTANFTNKTYWKYTVPAVGGGRSELKLRIYRDDYSTDAGKVSAIMICSEATGWSDNEVFTIPGTAIGGASPANDIEFGLNTNETSTGTADGKCSILTTNLGSGANMFQKHPDGGYGVLRLENDSSKKFGHTYWGFALHPDNYQLSIQSGSGWSYLNKLGKHYKSSSSYEGFFGCFNGEEGLDRQNVNNHLHRYNTTYHTIHQYATSNGPTTYPLKIRYYKAQAPQDSNFAVIQFLQTQNQIDIPFFTFSLNKGVNFGANIWDLDKVWNGSYTNFNTQDIEYGSTGQSSNWVETQYTTPGYHSGSSGPHHEPIINTSLAREASYGYLRTPSAQYLAKTRYVSNVDTENTNNYNQVYTYFRSSAYDKYTGNDDRVYNYADRLSTVGVGYHKPIKGLPINNSLIPCPYYMPDDFVMIQAEVTPGATKFRTGDTVTVSATEIYEIIIADNLVNQTGLDGISNNTANGMIFAARTT